MKHAWMMGLALLACLAGCGEHKPQAPQLPKTADDTRMFDSQRDALNRAKALEKTLQQQSQAQKQSLDQQSE